MGHNFWMNVQFSHTCEISFAILDTIVLSAAWIVPLDSEPESWCAVDCACITDCSQEACMVKARTNNW